MAFLQELATESRVPLEPEHTVGRAGTCSLRLPHDYVSAQHAMIRHDDRGWALRDLGSLNGTWLGGRRIPPGEEHRLWKGARIAFGGPAAEWEMVDDAPPSAMVVPLDGAPPVLVDGDIVALPSADNPSATIYRGAGDGWVLEAGDAPAAPIGNLRVFHCAGRAWRFSCPVSVRSTIRSDVPPADVGLRDLKLEFIVSLDEEHVVLRARCADRVVDLGERTHHYLLLTLARARLAEARSATPETACGWTDVECLCRDSKVTRGQVSVDVFRIRKQFIDKGIADAARIVERRPGQLRIGTANASISRG